MKSRDITSARRSAPAKWRLFWVLSLSRKLRFFCVDTAVCRLRTVDVSRWLRGTILKLDQRCITRIRYGQPSRYLDWPAVSLPVADLAPASLSTSASAATRSNPRRNYDQYRKPIDPRYTPSQRRRSAIGSSQPADDAGHCKSGSTASARAPD